MGTWRRRNYQLGGSRALTYPSDITVGEEASVAGNRLLLIDPRGEIDENELGEFLEKHVEPAFWKWWRQKEAAKRPKVEGIMRVMEAEAPIAEEVQSVQTQDVNPGPRFIWSTAGIVVDRSPGDSTRGLVVGALTAEPGFNLYLSNSTNRFVLGAI